MLIVAEILRHGERRLTNPKAAARRLIHLTENHYHVLEHTRGFHVAIQILALATSLADAADNTDPLPASDHVVNHLGEEHRLGDTRSSKESRLSSALQGKQHVNGFDAGLKDLRLGYSIG